MIRLEMTDALQSVRILAAAASRNGRISPPEEAVIRRVAKALGVADVDRVLAENYRGVSLASLLPQDPSRRAEALASLRELVSADGVVTPQEEGLLRALR